MLSKRLSKGRKSFTKRKKVINWLYNYYQTIESVFFTILIVFILLREKAELSTTWSSYEHNFA
jgi:hypothetical protein